MTLHYSAAVCYHSFMIFSKSANIASKFPQSRLQHDFDFEKICYLDWNQVSVATYRLLFNNIVLARNTYEWMVRSGNYLQHQYK